MLTSALGCGSGLLGKNIVAAAFAIYNDVARIRGRSGALPVAAQATSRCLKATAVQAHIAAFAPRKGRFVKQDAKRTVLPTTSRALTFNSRTSSDVFAT